MNSLYRKLLVNGKRSYSVYRYTRLLKSSKRYCCSASVEPSYILNEDVFQLKPEEVPPIEKSNFNISVLQEQTELTNISHIGPPIDYRSFNFAAFVNHSNTLKKLVDLGVNLYTVERKIPKPDYLVQLDFEEDINPYIQFLLDKGLSIEELGRFFTKNPYFFQNSLNDLQVRLNYLEWKKFTPELMKKVISSYPTWLNYTTLEVDKKLGIIQKEFQMSAFEIRLMLQNYPRIISVPEYLLRNNLFEMNEVQQFSIAQCRRMLVNYPYFWNEETEKIKERLEYVLMNMEVPHWLVVADPIPLVNKKAKLHSRHTFLKSIGRAQYDPRKPNYITMRKLCYGSDADFCLNTAKTSVNVYNMFLKTL